MLVVFLGPPGAGKGTQAERLVEHLKIPSLSTGQMLREAKESGSKLGNSIQELLDTGQLVDDKTVVQMVVDCLNEPRCQNGALLDGFPRTIEQAKSLDVFLADTSFQLDWVVQLVVPEEELHQRLAERYLKMDSPRPEDHPDHIPTRINLYNSITSHLTEYYSSKGILGEVNGMGTEDEVFERIKTSLDNYNK